MPLSSSQLDAFRALVQEKSFTLASKRLHLTQSALSQRIMNLESELGATLIIRDRSGLQLTEIAQELLRYCKTKEHLENEFLRQVESPRSSLLSGTVRIAGFSSVMRSVILPGLSRLVKKNPDLKLVLLTRELRELPELLRNGEADFVVLDHALEREGIVTSELGIERNSLVEKRGYDGPDVYLDHDEEDQTTVRYLRLAGKNTTRLRRMYLDDIYGVLDGVRLGLGRAPLPLHLVRGDKELRVIDPEITLKTPVTLNFYHQPFYSRVHREVLNHLETNCRTLL